MYMVRLFALFSGSINISIDISYAKQNETELTLESPSEFMDAVLRAAAAAAVGISRFTST
jgi:hypothetical protein